MAELLPGIKVAQSYGDLAGQLLPAEEPFIAAAVDERRSEYRTVRLCARVALAELGVETAAIVNDSEGVPGWPPGVVGSLTHCEGYRAAAVASASRFAGLGIDAEPHTVMPAGVLQAVASDAEIARLPTLKGVALDRVIWTVKESAYKAWFPLTRCWVAPRQLMVCLEPAGPADGTFTVQVLESPEADAAPVLIHGRWAVDEFFALAAATIPSDGARPDSLQLA